LNTDRILFFAGLVIISILAIALIFPIYWMIKGSFQTLGSIMKIPPEFVPKNLTLRNYIIIFSRYPVFRWFLNSIVVSFATIILSISFPCLSGYVFAKKTFPGKNMLFWILLLTMMIPFQITLIPLFITMKNFHLYNTYPGIFLPMSCGIWNMFLARQYISTIPSELIDSAKIDGASELKIFTSIIIPLAKPLIAALTIFTFVGSWNNFLWPLIITGTDKMRTLPIAAALITSQPAGTEGAGYSIDTGFAMVGATLVGIPIYIIFLTFQKYFTKGITLGAIKG